MYLSDYFELQILNTINGIPFTAPGTAFLALSSVNPGDAGQVTEPTYTGYARLPIAFTVPAVMSGGIGIQNTLEIQYAQSTQDDATITHIGVFDSISGGNMLTYAPLSITKPIRAGVAPVLRAGEAKFWLTGNFSTVFKTAILNAMRGTNLSAVTPYATLFNGDPEAGGTELTGGGFSRKLITFGTTVNQPSGQSTITNNAPVMFDVATANLGTYNFDAVMSAASGGILIASRQGVSDTYAAGDRTSYDTGAYTISVN